MQLTVSSPKHKLTPLSSIVRDARGRPIGRILRLLVERQIVACDYTRGPPLGRFDTEKAARAAIRAKHKAAHR